MLRRSFTFASLVVGLAILPTFGTGCAAEATDESMADQSANALSSVDVACGANTAQIGLAGAGAATAVAGYLTAAAIAIEGLVAAGAEAQLLTLGKNFSVALIEMGGATAEAQALSAAVSARNIVGIGSLLTTFLAKMGTNGNVKNILTLGYRVLEAMYDGAIELDRINPLGVQKNLDYLNDGLRFACNNCGEQWACPEGVTASRMEEYDITKKLENDTPAIAQGRDCAANTTFWSTRSYLGQCYDCCDEAGYTDDQTSAFHACRAVCNAAYK